MYIKYGPFQFNEGEAWPTSLTQGRQYNPRGRAQLLRKRLSIRGLVRVTGQSAITTRVDQILAALSAEGFSAGFYQDDNSPTSFYLDGPSSRGVRIVENSLLAEEGKAHYVNALPFSITFEADYGINDGDNLVIYSETITRIGNGGPREVVTELDSGVPYVETVSTHTPVIVVQQGNAVGASSAPSPPVPIFGVDSAEDVQSYGRPRLDGVVFTDYQTRWSYRKTLPTAPAFGPLGGV